MNKVKCRTLYNQVKYVDAEDMIQRPSVYGLVIHDGYLLVGKTSHTQRYVLPGGGIDKGEEIDIALIREVREETGITVTLEDFLHFHTDFFYYDPLDLAIHGFLFYYLCTPIETEISQPEQPEIEDLEDALWVDIKTLSEEDFQTHGGVVLQLLATLV
ncbi:MAG: NUDIX domain-containing protein [Chloroflexota bacterium]